MGTVAASTVKPSALEAAPLLGVTVTSTAPGASVAGTVAVTEVALHEVAVATVAPKRTEPPEPRSVPAMTTDVPVRPWLGVRLLIAAVGTGVRTVML